MNFGWSMPCRIGDMRTCFVCDKGLISWSESGKGAHGIASDHRRVVPGAVGNSAIRDRRSTPDLVRTGEEVEPLQFSEVDCGKFDMCARSERVDAW